eukprot:CAMPEP_0182812386 /NCGR_PEP_ID=MMETSP0006_2-20121128/8779_1 /TAXON_ID=97485 /ORGANISM="Prymnesium parvum, Strain Texoma1" /LENGTH=125 /DNA_ID=CAMNT_0024938413 /DNA_START=689 /DNA_END=1066 /DNA_ORIENTATION=+
MGAFFCASLEAKKITAPCDTERWALLMPQRVAFWIYWHAACLLYSGVTFHSHPRTSGSSAYKERACRRAESMGRSMCPAAGLQSLLESTHPHYSDEHGIARHAEDKARARTHFGGGTQRNTPGVK